MAAGRFLGDYLQCKLGKKRLLFLAGLVASVSLGLAVLAPSLPLGQLFCIVGLGGTGCGLSVLIPVVFQSTGETSSDNPAAALAALSGCGYFGLVVGPPVLGGLSKATSLRYSLLVDAVLLSGIAWCARELPEPLVDRHKILEQRTYELVGDEGTAGERSLPEHQEVKFDARFCIDDTEAEVVSV
jgi:MFS family permease